MALGERPVHLVSVSLAGLVHEVAQEDHGGGLVGRLGPPGQS